MLWTLVAAAAGGAPPSGPAGEGIEWLGCAVSVRGRPILEPTSGAIGPGRLLGILGPSGAGKSTLMHLLGGALRAGSGVDAVGHVRFVPSGLPVELAAGDVAFLPQAAALFGGLTVRETLVLAARLHGRPHARADAEAALGALGLAHAADVPVGERSAGGLRSGGGISGGEARRLSIGCAALLSLPRLLLADEPTSGLDSAAALRVVLQLRSIARANNLPAALSLHQPRSAIFHALDDVLLLAQGGRVVFHGAREAAEPHFNALGCVRPEEAGVAEWLVDLVAIDTEDATAAARDAERVARLADAWEARGSSGWQAAAALPGAERGGGALLASPQRRRPAARAGRPGFGRRLLLLSARAAVQRLRAWPLLLTRAGAAWLLAHVLAQVYPAAAVRAPAGPRLVGELARGVRALGRARGAKAGGRLLRPARSLAPARAAAPISPSSVADRITLLSFGAISLAFSAVAKTLTLIGGEAAVVGHERALGLCGASEYVLAQLAAEAPLDALVALVFAETLRGAARLRMGRGQANGAFAAAGLASTTLGLAVGSLAPSADSALVAGVPILVLFTVLGVINPSGQSADAPPRPRPLRLLTSLSPIGAAIRALLTAELSGAKLDRGPLSIRNAPRMGGLALVKSGDEVLYRLGLAPQRSGGRRAPGPPSRRWLDGVRRLLLISLANMAVAMFGALATRPRFITPRRPPT